MGDNHVPLTPSNRRSSQVGVGGSCDRSCRHTGRVSEDRDDSSDRPAAIEGRMTLTRRRFLTRVAAAGGVSHACEAMTGLGLLAKGSLAGTLDSPAAGPRRFRRRHRRRWRRPDRPAAQAAVMGTGGPDLRRRMADRPAFRLYRADPLLPISAHRPTQAGVGACEFRPTQIRCGGDSASSAASHRVH
jgi:hypothetical protein